MSTIPATPAHLRRPIPAPTTAALCTWSCSGRRCAGIHPTPRGLEALIGGRR